MNKKTLAVVTFYINSGEFYSKQITNMFHDSLNVKTYCFENGSIEEGIDADLILILSYSLFEAVKKHVSNNSEIIVANRTLSKDDFNKLKKLAEGTRAMLVNVSAEMSMETISLIYQLGARHIDITPYYPGMENSTMLDIAITPAELKYVPSYIKQIIDIGNRMLDISTIMDIAVKLELDFILDSKSVLEYTKHIAPISYGLEKMIGTTNMLESQLNILLQVFDDGVIGVDRNGKIISFNENAEKILDMSRERVFGKKGEELFPQIPFGYTLNTKSPIKEKMIKYNGYDVIVCVLPITNFNTIYGAVSVIKRFSDLEKKQHKLRTQLIGKGHCAKYSFDDILGASQGIVKAKNIAARMSKSDSSILIMGETGTGKELFAQAIHNCSKRSEYQFVAINCAALPESLLESELFGYEEGAFTGAKKGGKPGLFEMAHMGTLFLDEIGEIPLALQARLLRVLQEREVMRIGGDSIIKVDVRIIAATNRDLKNLVDKGLFRRDLYFRLNVLPLRLPSLRERVEDIPLLIENIKKDFTADFELSEDAAGAFLKHSWDGNIRELRNYIEYLANLDTKQISLKDLPFDFKVPCKSEDMSEEQLQVFDRFINYIRYDTLKYQFVLEQLDLAYKEFKKTGRRSIVEAARNNNIHLTEQEARRVLLELEGFKLAAISTGRGGTKITELGKAILRKLLKG